MTKRWRESKKEKAQKERWWHAATMRTVCSKSRRERRREREGRNERSWRVRNTANMRVNNRGGRKKKYLKLLHSDFIHGGEHFQIEQELTLASTATQNIWKTEIPTTESKYPKCAQMCAKVCNQPQTTKQTGDTRMAHRTSHLVEAWNHGD